MASGNDPFASLRSRIDDQGRPLDRYGRLIGADGMVADDYGRRRDSETAEILSRAHRDALRVPEEEPSIVTAVYTVARIAFLIFCVVMIFVSIAKRRAQAKAAASPAPRDDKT